MTGLAPRLVLETDRLRLRHLAPRDDAFILRLLNDPSFVRNIGDRGVRSLEDARRYLAEGPIASYARHGHGLYGVELKASGVPAGMCGLIKRDYLEDPDVGFAFLPEFWGRGYAFESAAAVVSHGFESLGLRRVLGIVSPGNAASIGVLAKLGLRYERMVRPPGEASDVALYATATRPTG